VLEEFESEGKKEKKERTSLRRVIGECERRRRWRGTKNKEEEESERA